MSNKEFETKVLEKLGVLDILVEKVSDLQFDMKKLKGKVDVIEKRTFITDAKVDRLYDKIDKRADDIELSIENNSKYINQSFQHINDLKLQKSY